MTVIGKEGAWAHEATTWFSFREAEEWVDFSNGKDLALLLGDRDCGPLIELTSRPPEPEEMPRAPAHGHASDNWRITIQGTTNMGRYAYGAGQFRFQDGGVPYAGDNLAWGPAGGFGIIMFADRRGSPIRFVDPNHEFQAGADAGARAFADAYGFALRDPCPGAPAFHPHDPWPDAARAPGYGVRGIGLVGGSDTRRAACDLPARRGDGRAGPGAAALRSRALRRARRGRFRPKCSMRIVAGSCVVDGSHRELSAGEREGLAPRKKRLGDAWVTEPGPQPEVVAGPGGLSHIVVFADRRAVGGFTASGDAASRNLAASLLRETAALGA